MDESQGIVPRYTFGFDCFKLNNIEVIDEKTAVYISGAFVVIFDLETLVAAFLLFITPLYVFTSYKFRSEQRIIPARTGNGIGAFTVCWIALDGWCSISSEVYYGGCTVLYDMSWKMVRCRVLDGEGGGSSLYQKTAFFF